MPLSIGARLGPYEILSLLGAGGMGEVYKARDTRLERTVAVKVLPAHTASSPEARQRFEREARTISQLSHPHICALFDVGREGDVEYLVMELLEGETLSDRLAKGALAREQTLRFGEQIADALDKAHRQGVVHRDLKPANVMLTKTGVKLLDFGLAKRIAAADSRAGSVTSLPTQQQQKGLTQEGAILGTFQYMAPEQLEGKEADARTDIHALGAVLYEMATGRKAFAAASQASLITAIMSADPPSISSLQPMAPAALDRIVRTCLAKDPEERWQSAADVRRELRWVTEGSAAEPGAAVSPRNRNRNRERAAWVAAVLGLLFGAAALWRGRAPSSAPELMRFAIAPPPGQWFIDVALSPDGRRILATLNDSSERSVLWVRALDGLAMKPLPGTEGARAPFWSPDGREVAFHVGGKLKRMSAEGGPLQTICESGSGFGGAWSRDGSILFTAEFGTPILVVPASGGMPRPVTTLDVAAGETAHFYPSFLPDGRHFVFVARHLDPEKTEVKVGSLDDGTSRPLLRADSAALYVAPGYLLYAKDNVVLARAFDASRLRLLGDAAPAFEGARYATEDNRLVVSAAAGRLAYLPWPQRRRLAWVDRRGKEAGTVGDVAAYEDVNLSADGRRVAVSRRDPDHGQNLDLWVLDVGRGVATRVTSERSDEFSPVWFPDGERLAFVSDRGGSGFYDLYEASASGGPARPLLSSTHDKTQPSISRDGRHLLFAVAENGRYGLEEMSLGAGGGPRRLDAGTRFNEGHPEASPSGRWVAFNSDESGSSEVYLEPFEGGGKRQVSVGGGHSAIWRPDGKELFYVSRDGTLMAVSIRETGAAGLEVGEPQPLFALQVGSDPSLSFFRRPYDVAPDGERFLVIRRAVDAEPESAVVVLNWLEALARTSTP